MNHKKTDKCTRALSTVALAAALLASSCDSLAMKTDLKQATLVQTKVLEWTSVDIAFQTTTPYWRGLAVADDGNTMVASLYGFSLLSMKDGGRTNTGVGTLVFSCNNGAFAASADARTILLAENSYLHRSVDGGNSTVGGPYFPHQEPLANNWADVALSDSGALMAASSGANTIHISSNGGANWSILSGPFSNMPVIGLSGDGSTLVTCDSNEGIIVTRDAGTHFTSPYSYAEGKDCVEFALSRDGSRIVAATGDKSYGTVSGYLYVTSDGGVSWTKASGAGLRHWTSVACSADGMVIAACATGASGDFILRSKDGGLSWSIESAAGQRKWAHVASSADGLVLAAVANDSTAYFIGR
jgi:hypothetical protein